jgi:hypothetical protein
LKVLTGAGGTVGCKALRFPGSKQIIKRQKQALAQLDHDRFLRTRQRGLQTMRGVQRIGKNRPRTPLAK